MKKIFLFISPLIAFFLGGFILSFNCKANALPSPTPETFSTITNANNSLSFSLFSNVDVLPINSNPVDLYRIIQNVANDPLVVGTQLNLMENNDYTISALTQTEKENYQEIYPYLYDVNGNTVSWDDVYHLHYMNAMFHGDVYIDLDGNILTSDQNNTKTMFQLGAGGYLLQVSDIANIYDQIADELVAQQYIIATSGDDLSNYNLSYYLHSGYVTSRLKVEGWIYVPNMYDVGHIVISNNQSDGQSATFYYNNGAQFEFKNITSDAYYVRSANNTIGGVTYTKYIVPNGAIYNNSNTSRTDFNRGVSGPYNFSGTVFDYDTSLLNSIGETVAFKKLQFPENVKPLQFDDTYNYNDIKQLEQNLNSLSATPNETFDPSESISELNYPLNIPYNGTEVNPSELPFPEIQTTPMPDPGTAPSIGSDIGEVDPTELRSTIPVINNLLNRFPFSIPWDIYGLLSGLSVQRETPYINTTIHIPGINYDWVLDYDLSDFDGIASLFRTLFLIAFILGLAYFSYDHFFGS